MMDIEKQTIQSCLEIRLLGGFALRYEEKPVTAVNTPRLQSLLAYLLLHSHAPQSRHHLAFMFWPDSNEAQALTNLRKHLLHLKGALPDAERLLLSVRHTIHWSPQVAVTCDVVDFQRALTQAAGVEGHLALPTLRQAAALYQGELLPGCYEEWLLPVREALHAQNIHLLERLSQLLEEQRHYPEAITYAQQLLRYDPLHEATYRRLMRLYALNDDRATALRTYHTCLTHLREELGVDPDPETQNAFERLLQLPTHVSSAPVMPANAPFVGRQKEWQQLQGLWRTAQRGQPHFVLLAGEAGIGKTRLAEELLSWAYHQGICTARARCYAAEGQLTYAPVMDWLRAEALRPHRARIELTWLSELARLLPEILREFPTVPPPAPITPTWQRRHLFEAITRTLLAAQQPLLLLLDDLQWCDQETLEWLHFLLRSTEGPLLAELGQVQLLVVGTARFPDEVPAGHPLEVLLNNLRSREHFIQIEPARLSKSETNDLARQMAGEALSGQSLRDLYADTAGNPLFIVETVRAGQSGLVGSGGQSQATPRPAGASSPDDGIRPFLPPKVLAVLQARLGQLSPVARELCEWAAIIGRAFTLELLTAAGRQTEESAVAALDELWRRRIVREHGADAYDFSHDRIRDVVAMGISRVRRRHLHRCVAAALAEQADKQVDSNAAQIAAHYEAAGVVEKAIAYYEQAATAASQIYANHETVAHWQRALHLLNQLPATQARDQRELTFLNAIGPALAALTGYTSQQLCEVYERAYTLSQQLGVPPNPALLRILAVHKIGVGTFAQVQSMGLHLLALAQLPSSAIDPILYVEGSYLLGVNAFWQGQFTQAQAYLQQALAAYAPERHEQHVADYGLDPGPYCRARLGFTLWYLGFPDQARRQCELAIGLTRELNHPFTLYLVMIFAAWLDCDCRDISAAETHLRLFRSHMDAPSSQILNVVQFLEGWSFSQRGAPKNGIPQIHDYITWRQMSKTDHLYGAHAFAILAEAYSVAGEYAQAEAALAQGFTFLKGGQEYWFAAELYRLQGELRLAQAGSSADAHIWFQQALAIAREQQAKALELRAAMSLARLWAQQGKQEEAYTLLAEVYGWFTEGFETADLQEAQALLVQLQ